MGYFANGSEGEAYEARYCDRCAHQKNADGTGCAVWALHLIHNYEGGRIQVLLDELIPQQDGRNLACLMFFVRPVV